ncbi:MAG: restriction endonuclease [Taibaiella sp.]|jgi:hypothetical protein
MKTLEYIEKIARELGLDVRGKAENALSIWTSPFLGISLQININNREEISFYFSQRTTSWVYNGERTDLHDVIPIVFALFLKHSNLCSLYFTDVFNPATGADDEIYSKYLTPFQVDGELLNVKSEKYLKGLEYLVSSLSAFETFFWSCFPGCPCENCRKKLGYKFEYSFDIPEEVISNLSNSIDGSGDCINYCQRTLPNWLYFRDFKKRVSIIKSNELYPLIDNLIMDNNETVRSLSGKLIVGNNFNHYIGNAKSRDISNVFKKLGDKKKNITFIENRIIALGEEYIVCFNFDCGIDRFQIEKGRLKSRHEREFRLLFAPSELGWAGKIEDSRFENLVKDLLEREPSITRVRKTGHTRERDGGVDLVIDKQVPKDVMSSKESNPYKTLKIAVQCKAYKDGVSKSQITDIRDTIEFRNYDGYFLVVSSYIKNSLSDHLDKLRTDGKFWIDWWTFDEIEKRLKLNRDLIEKYRDIVQLKK